MLVIRGRFTPIRPWTLKRIHSPVHQGPGTRRSPLWKRYLFLPLVPAPGPRGSRPQFQTNLKLDPGAPAPTSHLLFFSSIASSLARPLAHPLARCTGSGSRRTHIYSCNVRRRGSDPCSRSTPMSSWRQDSDDTAPPTALRSGARASAHLVLNPAPAASTITRTLTI